MSQRKNPFRPEPNFSQATRQGMTPGRPSPKTIEEKEKIKKVEVVQMPNHAHLPPGAQSVDLRNLADVTAGTSETIIDFTVPNGSYLYLLGYAIYNDGLLASDYDFIPRVDGRRIYEFHGDPLQDFRIYLGLTTDFRNDSIVQAPMQMQPGSRLTWIADNRSGVDTTMGVRVKGYIMRGGIRFNERFGG